MQITNNTSASALIQNRSNVAQIDDATTAIRATNNNLADKQPNQRRHSEPQSSTNDLTKKVQNSAYINVHRVNPSSSVSNQALAKSSHSAQRAVATFQQIDRLADSELMPRIDATA